jgi:hypothetical protein
MYTTQSVMITKQGLSCDSPCIFFEVWGGQSPGTKHDRLVWDYLASIVTAMFIIPYLGLLKNDETNDVAMFASVCFSVRNVVIGERGWEHNNQ